MKPGRFPPTARRHWLPWRYPAFWTVEADASREAEKSYILTSGDPLRPEMDHPVEPGWPFAPKKIDFHDGRVEAFSDWLTAPENPMFARVAMNRLWQWHFGEGLEKTTSDFGRLADAGCRYEAARLARERVRSSRLQHEADESADRDIRCLPPSLGGQL